MSAGVDALTIPETYFGLITRQKNRLDRIERLCPILRKCAQELPPNPSMTSIAKWLEAESVPIDGKEGASTKWNSQSVERMLYLDGAKPLSDGEGFLVTATRTYRNVRPLLAHDYGEKRAAYEEKRFKAHLQRVIETAIMVRDIFWIPSEFVALPIDFLPD